MWYWDPVSCNEALPGVHDLSLCTNISDDDHPFKTKLTPSGKQWGSDHNKTPVLIDDDLFSFVHDLGSLKEL
ncbi:TPA: hypothetical protein KE234_000510 [Citrobacter koseri]|uniref:hypothetical protein n=1 Tax=Citrobacter koseri TaxID=545 RepID=UPI001BA2E8A9|nr:hypothetical protein [Citrobacter koseri]HBC7342183.1 hypothetical protein [Citrobacter koseri]HBC8644011.1 hypothetical protein [Citrobacter koseri]